MDYAKATRDNELRVLAAEQAGEEVVPGLPIKFNIEFTADCNIHCRMCDCELSRQRCRRQGRTDFHMPEELFRGAVSRVFPVCSIVNPSLVGEPLVLPYMDALIEAAAHHAVRLDIVTNGVLLTGAMSRSLLPVLSGMMVSVDGATRATFERIRNGASFPAVVANLAEFSRLRDEMGLAERVQLCFSTALMRENIRELPAIVDLAAQYKVDAIVASHLVVFRPELLDSSLIHAPDLVESYLEIARRKALALGVEPRFPAPLHQGDAAQVLRTGGAAPGTAVDEQALEMEASQEAESPGTHDSASPRAAQRRRQDRRSERRHPAKTAITECRPDHWRGRYYCKFPWRETFVSLGGELSPCCAQGRPVFGNAFSADIEELWNGPEYRRLRRGLMEGDLTSYCRQCTYLQESGYLDYDGSQYPRLR